MGFSEEEMRDAVFVVSSLVRGRTSVARVLYWLLFLLGLPLQNRGQENIG
jgi:hypothetical protein